MYYKTNYSDTRSQHNDSNGTRKSKNDGDTKNKEKPLLDEKICKKGLRKIRQRIKQRQKIRRALKKSFATSEQTVLCEATEQQLQLLLENDKVVCDIQADCTPYELQGEIALAKGHATTLYIKRDGLSTLTVVLPQAKPTIANLKRGIEQMARIQQQREQRQRNEDRLRRRNELSESNSNSSNSNDSPSQLTTKTCRQTNQDDDDNDDDNVERTQNRQQVSKTSPTQRHRKRQKKAAALQFVLKNLRTSGELVYAETHSGQQHRSNVSWCFLWRAYALFNPKTQQPLDDTNGRRLLSECGIENAATLKFCNREKYFGRKRQKANGH